MKGELKKKRTTGHRFTNLPYPSGRSLSSVVEFEPSFGPLVERQLAVETIVAQARGLERRLGAISPPSHYIAPSSLCVLCTSYQNPRRCIGPARLHLLVLSEKAKYHSLS